MSHNIKPVPYPNPALGSDTCKYCPYPTKFLGTNIDGSTYPLCGGCAMVEMCWIDPPPQPDPIPEISGSRWHLHPAQWKTFINNDRERIPGNGVLPNRQHGIYLSALHESVRHHIKELTMRTRRRTNTTLGRPSFAVACAQYINRYTLEHVPHWAKNPVESYGIDVDAKTKRYYAPQYASDKEWYENTKFPGEPGHVGDQHTCYSTKPTWPLGQWLEVVYLKQSNNLGDKHGRIPTTDDQG